MDNKNHSSSSPSQNAPPAVTTHHHYHKHYHHGGAEEKLLLKALRKDLLKGGAIAGVVLAGKAIHVKLKGNAEAAEAEGDM
ncbi:hypothetical protein Droror1_Dr00003695 [Drosera rotundifolia]